MGDCRARSSPRSDTPAAVGSPAVADAETGATPRSVVFGTAPLVGDGDDEPRGEIMYGPSGEGRCTSGARAATGPSIAGDVARWSVRSDELTLPRSSRFMFRRLAANEKASRGRSSGFLESAAMSSVSSSRGTGTNRESSGGGLCRCAEPMRWGSPSSSNGPRPAMIS